MPPKLNRTRAPFVLTKIDEILAWERRNEAERDTRFVDLGRYLCEVRAGQSPTMARSCSVRSVRNLLCRLRQLSSFV